MPVIRPLASPPAPHLPRQRRAGYVLQRPNGLVHLLQQPAVCAVFFKRGFPLPHFAPDAPDDRHRSGAGGGEGGKAAELVVQRGQLALGAHVQAQQPFVRHARAGQHVVQRAQLPAAQPGVARTKAWLRRWSSSLLTKMLKTMRANSSSLLALISGGCTWRYEVC